MKKIIMGIQVEQRSEVSTEVQKILTEFGCFIKTRLGLHNVSDHQAVCSEKGLILLEFVMDAEQKVSELEQSLSSIEGVVIRKMEF